MKNIFKISSLTLIASLCLGVLTHAEETVGEKVKDEARDAKRATKETVNRAKEKVCAKGDAKCAAEQAKNRMSETGESVGDKAKEVKNKVD